MTAMKQERKGPRVLQIAHNHPSFHPGGTEIVALALHREALAQGFDSWFLGALEPDQKIANPGTQMTALTPDHREAAILFDAFDYFALAQDDHYGGLREFAFYLRQVRPDVIHVHHILHFGLELFLAIRRNLPDAKIILTLHDYYLVCPNHGQMFKHQTMRRCSGPTLADCMACFPGRPAADFVMRRLAIARALSLVDHLVAPSHFLKTMFETHLADCPPITFVENGFVGLGSNRPAGAPCPPCPNHASPPVFGYFGNISAVKGLADLLEAAEHLDRRGHAGFCLHVHGSQLFEDAALAGRIEKAKDRLGDRLRLFGRYEGSDIATHYDAVDHVVFPSLWWENAPLVIYEALHHGKNVIAYPHGGAPEILARYGTGILARRSDPYALADAMERILCDGSLAIDRPPPVPDIKDLLEEMLKLYGKGAKPALQPVNNALWRANA
jgi:glycosyltransferase involved in cell wall biosynthesis